jgi:hypothetical protein
LPTINADTLVANIKAILALNVIDVVSVDKIYTIDEELGPLYGFDKITRLSYLS